MNEKTKVSREFQIIDPARTTAENCAAFNAREVPLKLRSHAASAGDYEASTALLDAINAAIAVGAPLLITGDPGTGKTQAAYYAARLLDAPEVFKLDVTSECVATDVFYNFDRLAHFHAANVSKDPKLDPMPFLHRGPLWRAFEETNSGRPAVVLIDEIDKAPRDFPNGLLNALDQYTFHVAPIDHTVKGDPTHPPLVVLTSNSEKRLPEPLLRRCIYHFIAFDDEHAQRIVEKRCDGFPNLELADRGKAFRRFQEVRARPLRKKPATGELLVWLTVLSARGKGALSELDNELDKLPALYCLVKDNEDLGSL